MVIKRVLRLYQTHSVDFKEVDLEKAREMIYIIHNQGLKSNGDFQDETLSNKINNNIEKIVSKNL